MEFNWQTKDGINIFGKEWKAEDPKAVIALVHGFGEHCMRYDDMAKYYVKHGYAMLGYDRRGHGQSSGPRGHTPSYQHFLDEVDDLIKACKERYPGKPVVIYGHSMGGNIVLNYMLQNPDSEIKLTIVTGPWIKLTKEPPGFVKMLVRMLRKIAPAYGQGKKLGTYISRVQEEVDKYMNDPLVHGRITLNTADGMFKAGERLLNYKGAMAVPTLIMHAGDDELTDPKASKTFVDNVSGDVTLSMWDGLYHEIHNESIREQVYDFAINWLNEKP